MTGPEMGHRHPLESIRHVQGGAPMLDIGGDIGALVVILEPAAAGSELHLRRDGVTGSVHTGVWTRSLGVGEVTAAVFCELAAGGYWVLGDDGVGRQPVSIVGGTTTEIDLRDRSVVNISAMNRQHE